MDDSDDGATHYYGDGCNHYHGRADHPLAHHNIDDNPGALIGPIFDDESDYDRRHDDDGCWWYDDGPTAATDDDDHVP